MTTTLRLDSLTTDPATRRSLADLSLAVAKSKKIVVVTGAGISCSCGIPDFRSSDGLYNLVKQQYPDVVLKGRDLFDASLFRDPTSTAVFYTFISQLKQSIDNATPAPTHRFIKTLDSKGKLLRSYTQNIDGLEAKAGLSCGANQDAKAGVKVTPRSKTKHMKNVQLHGDIHRVRCTFCSANLPCAPEHLETFGKGVAPDCPECTTRSDARIARSARPLKIGTLRPAIVLYDEPHPLGDDIGTIQTSDVLHKPDMLIVMGTSLKVHGLKKLVKDFAKAVHASSLPTSSPSGKPRGKVIFVNKTAPSGEWSDVIDYHVEGETDRWVEKVIEDWKKTRPADWELQQTLAPEDGTSVFKTVKRVATVAPTAKGQANKKKPAPGSENVPPVVPSDPEGLHKKTKSLTPPLSPSKRRQPTEHYSDGECSPSKKRGVLSHAENLSQDERVLLFVEEGTKAKTKGSEKLDAGAKAAPRKVRRAKSMCVLLHHVK